MGIQELLSVKIFLANYGCLGSFKNCGLWNQVTGKWKLQQSKAQLISLAQNNCKLSKCLFLWK